MEDTKTVERAVPRYGPGDEQETRIPFADRIEERHTEDAMKLIELLGGDPQDISSYRLTAIAARLAKWQFSGRQEGEVAGETKMRQRVTELEALVQQGVAAVEAQERELDALAARLQEPAEPPMSAEAQAFGKRSVAMEYATRISPKSCTTEQLVEDAEAILTWLEKPAGMVTKEPVQAGPYDPQTGAYVGAPKAPTLHDAQGRPYKV